MTTTKICLITGGTSGIGKAAAVSLAQRGIHTVIVGRNPEKCLETTLYIKKKTGSGTVDFLVADLSSLKEIQRVADEFKYKYQRLDLLVNNVGARFMKYSVSTDGYEMTYALNHLSSFLLTNLLMADLRKSRMARIVNVSSGAHAQVLELDYFFVKAEKFDGRKAYAQSKLANLLFTYELSRRLADASITVNAVDPGGVATNFNKNNGIGFWLRHITAHLLARNLTGPRKGAETSVWLSTSKEVEGISGSYFRYRQTIRSSPGSYDAEALKRLWNLSEELTGLKQT